MGPLAQYILSVLGAAMLGAILQSLAGRGGMGTLVGMLAGIFLALTMLAPLVTLKLPDPARWLDSVSVDGQAISAQGKALAADAQADIITQRVEAYIQDKAAMHQAHVTAAVTLDETGVPVSVHLTGEIRPDARARLASVIETDLGIPKEAQQWE